MYCDFEEYVKNRKPDKLSLKNLIDPSLEKPYSKDELALLSHLAVICLLYTSDAADER